MKNPHIFHFNFPQIVQSFSLQKLFFKRVTAFFFIKFTTKRLLEKMSLMVWIVLCFD